MGAFRSLADVLPLLIWTGVLARRVECQQVTLAIVELEPAAIVALHQHSQEQVGVVVKGTLRLLIGAETRELEVGDTYAIASNVKHEAIAGSSGAVVIDAFSPIRSDWHTLPASPATTLRWP